MFFLPKEMRENYSPLYFLAALGAGGLAVSFFMYFMFMTPHPATPLPTWESWTAVFNNWHNPLSLLPSADAWSAVFTGEQSLATLVPTWESWSTLFNGGKVLTQLLTGLALLGITVFSLLHVRLLWWNIRQYRLFKQTEAYQRLSTSNAEVQLMAIPLTFGMTINVGFILGALFVPKLWSVVEYLFPLAMLAFGVVGLYAVRIFVSFMSRVLVSGSFDCSRNNNLSQLLAIFAFSMVGVGFSASAAMSTVPLTSGIAMMFSLLFISTAALLALTKLTLGFRAMLEHGIDREASVSLWIMIPIVTLSGIAIYRMLMGMHHNFGLHIEPIEVLVLFSILASVVIMFAVLGYAVMKRLGYFKTYITGTGRSVASYALVCPGVAGTVLTFFFIHKGLVDTGLLEKNSLAYLLLLIPLVALQFRTISTLFRLNSKLLKREAALSA